MKTDDSYLDRIERTEKQQTLRRRENQSRRRRYYMLGSILLVAFLFLAGPSLVSHSPMGRSIIASTADGFGIDASASSLRVGWITPLRINDLSITGREAGSTVTIEQLDTELTILDLLQGETNHLGAVSLRGVDAACEMQNGRCSIEDDLKHFFDQPSSGQTTTGTINLHDLTVRVKETANDQTWTLSQANTEVELLATSIQSKFSGVLSEPRGSEGSLQGTIEFGSGNKADDSAWHLDLTSDSLPLSVVSLVRRRITDLADHIPAEVRGDATGAIEVYGSVDGSIDAVVRQFQVRNLAAASPSQNLRRWNNQLATLDGRLRILGNRVIGEGLVATTDFARVTLNGAFSRSITLVGASDNPVRWLDALEGAATAEVDLASFERAMPGVLPLRQEAELVSGRVIASIESLPSHELRRRSLSIRSDSIRARSSGRPVMLEPIDLSAIVSSDQNQIRAERFDLKSSFASASGHGDLRSGETNIDVDFGRLVTMLRPIIDISDSAFAGSAQGKIQWNSSGQNEWRLVGFADARELLLSFPSGNQLRHPSLRLDVDAVGTWNGQNLDLLSVANAKLSSAGLNIRAELVQGIRNPSTKTALPIRIQGEGRLETLAGTLGPWLPKNLHDIDGGFTMNARAEVSVASGIGRLTAATTELTQPRVAYGDRYFSQPNVRMQFDGEYDWTSSDMQCRSMTVTGDAFSAAVQGEITEQSTDLEIAWRAILERIQGSVKSRIVSRPGATITQVGYQTGPPPKTEDWLVMGDCNGRFIITGNDQSYNVDTEFNGQRVALVQPPKASAVSQMMGPIPNRPSSYGQPLGAAQVVWSEPNLKINGVLKVAPTAGEVVTDSIKIASDWFASSLTGHANWNEMQTDLSVKGPARIKMDEVAKRLSQLTGTTILAEGIQETPIQINVNRKSDGHIAITVAGDLGWDSAEVAGVKIGHSTVPVRLTETTVFVSPSTIPVGDGRLNLAGEVNYRPGPLWMRVEPGRIAESIRVTPEMTDRWLKYLAPLASEASRIDGTLGAELDEAIIVIDNPQQSRVVGRLNIESVNMNAGPLGNQIIGGLQQLKALSQASLPQTAPNQSSTLIRMPAQTVDFMVDHGVVTHRRLFLDIDRATVITSGNVSFDGRMDLDAQVPLDARWLGSDLQGLAGQPVTLPIDGTLSRPSLDSSGVRKVVTQLGIQAVQSNAENYLQKQLGKSIDKLFGR
ncbi:hypothetical protein [Planctomycetes bacterium CA13]|uniref:hypothetical protein n=1 Tax=Novipirellula herctigrandis TaxID=2527986 RepID=UPI0011B54D22